MADPIWNDYLMKLFLWPLESFAEALAKEYDDD